MSDRTVTSPISEMSERLDKSDTMHSASNAFRDEIFGQYRSVIKIEGEPPVFITKEPKILPEPGKESKPWFPELKISPAPYEGACGKVAISPISGKLVAATCDTR